MVSRNLVICDQEERYAAALAHFFMKTKELALGVQVCNSVAQALRLQEESPIDILLIGSGYPQEERQKVRAESVFVLTQSEDVAHETHEKLINKYQSGEAILRDVIEQCQESVEPGNFFLGTVKKEKVRIIGIFSPVHRSRKTGYALRLGKDLAKTYNVLYLNLEMYGGIGGHFPEIGQTVADAVLTYTANEKEQASYQCVACVYPKKLSGEESTKKDVEEAIKKADTATKEKKKLILPEMLDTNELRYYQPFNERGPVITVMGMMIGILLYALQKQNIRKAEEERKKQMIEDYPEVISKLTLYLGAGMTVKKAWRKIIEGYMKEKEDENERYVYEEMRQTCHEMDSGVTEAEGYETERLLNSDHRRGTGKGRSRMAEQRQHGRNGTCNRRIWNRRGSTGRGNRIGKRK